MRESLGKNRGRSIFAPPRNPRFPMGYAVNTLEHHFLPFTANRDFKANPRLIVKGEGVFYWNHKGEKILDGSSGLFCCAAGHARKEIADAVAKQLMEVE